MTLYSLSPLPVHARRASRRAFTLVELIVTIVILGVLAALAIPAFSGVIDRSHDEVALVELAGIAREAAAIAALDGDRSTLAVSDVESGTAGTSGTAADGLVLAAEADANGGRSVWVRLTDESGAEIAATDVAALEARQRELGARATPGLLPAGVSSEAYGYVSYALSADAGRVMLTQRSRTGRCAVVWGDTSAATIDGVYDTLDGQCVADVTAAGDPGGGTGTGAGGGGVPPLITIADPDGETPVTIGDPDPLFPDPDISTFPPTAAVTDDTPGLWSVQWVTRSSQGDSYLAVSDVRAGELYLLAHRGDGTVTLAARTDAHGAVVDLEKGQEPGTGARDSYSFDTLFALTDTGSLLALDPTTLAARSTIATGLTGATAFDTYDPLLPTDRAYRAVVATTAGVKVIDTTTGTELADLGDPGGTVEALEVTFSTTTADPQDMDVVATGTFGTASRTYHFEDDVVSSAGWTTHTPTATTSISLSSFGDYASSATTVRRGTGYDVAAAGTAVAGTYAYMRDLAAGFTGTPMQQVMYGVDHDMGCVFAIDASDDSRRSIWCGSGALAGDATATHTVSTIAATTASPSGVASLGGTTYWLDDTNHRIVDVDDNTIVTLPDVGWRSMSAHEATGDLLVAGGDAYSFNVASGVLTQLTPNDTDDVVRTDDGDTYYAWQFYGLYEEPADGGTWRQIRSGDHRGGLATDGARLWANTGGSVSEINRTTGAVTAIADIPHVNTGSRDDYAMTYADGLLYLNGNNSIATVDPDEGVLRVVAGNAGRDFNGDGFRDGAGHGAFFDVVSGLAPAPGGGVLVADHGNRRVRHAQRAPAVPLIAGSASPSQVLATGSVTTLLDTPGSSPVGVAVAGGTAYWLDGATDEVRRVADGIVVATLPAGDWYDLAPAGDLLLAAGTTTSSFSRGAAVIDPSTQEVSLLHSGSARSVTSTDAGVVYYVDTARDLYRVGGRTVQAVGPLSNEYESVGSDGVRLFASYGSNLYQIDLATGGRTLVSDRLPSPESGNDTGSIVAGADTVYVNGRHTVVAVDIESGDVSHVAGAGSMSNAWAELAGKRDGDGRGAWFGAISGLGVSPSGTLLVSDRGNGTIRRIDPGGTVPNRTIADVAGTVTQTISLGFPAKGVAQTDDGTVYYLDDVNDVIRDAASGTSKVTLPAESFYDLQPYGDLLIASSNVGPVFADPSSGSWVRAERAGAQSLTSSTDGTFHLVTTSRTLSRVDPDRQRQVTGSYYAVAGNGGRVFAQYGGTLYEIAADGSRTTVTTGLPSHSPSPGDQGLVATGTSVYMLSGSSVTALTLSDRSAATIVAGRSNLDGLTVGLTGLWVLDAGTGELLLVE